VNRLRAWFKQESSALDGGGRSEVAGAAERDFLKLKLKFQTVDYFFAMNFLIT
jgi:hypothetical protein